MKTDLLTSMLKSSTLRTSVMVTVLLATGYTATTYADETAKAVIERNQNADSSIKKQKVLLNKAVTVNKKADKLNEDIQREIDRILDERRLAQETEEENVEHIKKVADDTGFEDFDVRLRSGLSPEQVESLLVGTGLEGLGKSYVKAEQVYGVNALVLVGISAHESSWGSSKFAVERNNLFGYQAYDSDTNKARYFKTKEEAILVVARHLSRNYLTKGAMYFNGYTLEGINVRYASDKNWNVGITKIVSDIAKQLDVKP